MGVRAGVVAGAVYAASAAACCLEATRSLAQFVDVRVYRMGGAAVLHGGDLYRLRFFWLPFTYPPFAAMLCAPLAAVPWWAAVALVTGASVAALPVLLYLALRLGGPVPWGWTVAFGAAAAAIWLEPVRTTLVYGQVDVLLAAAVVYDLTRPDTSRGKGAAIGLAAAVKLTPAIFVAYLLLTRRWRAAGTAAAVFAGTVAAGFSVLPRSSAWYWAGEFARPGHVSPVEDPENQSLLGVLARTLHTSHVLAWWLPLAAAVAAGGLALAGAAGRRGEEGLGFSLCAVTGLLVSPISWTHHWVIAVPALLVAGLAGWRAYRAGYLVTAALTAGGILTLVVVGWLRVARGVPGGGWLAMSGPAQARGAAYVIIGVFVLALATWYRWRAIRGPTGKGGTRCQTGRCCSERAWAPGTAPTSAAWPECSNSRRRRTATGSTCSRSPTTRTSATSSTRTPRWRFSWAGLPASPER